MSQDSIPKKSPLDVLILAAGLGTRMKSNVAKVLHKLDGRALIVHACRAATALEPRNIYVVVGHQAEQVQAAVDKALGTGKASFVHQTQQRGTGDALIAAKDALANAKSTILILSGDVPLVRPETLRALVNKHESSSASCTILTIRLENPTGYGRIVRDEAGVFVNIVEQKDANDEERQIREVNAGVYCFDSTMVIKSPSRNIPTLVRFRVSTPAPNLLNSKT